MARSVHYFNLFDMGCQPFLLAAQLPLDLVDGKVLSCGGKISLPALRSRLESAGLSAEAHT